MGAWIEILLNIENWAMKWSLLSWERGLKSMNPLILNQASVAPLVGAWIEIIHPHTLLARLCVAPLVGAWIEIFSSTPSYASDKSLLSWERGLK